MKLCAFTTWRHGLQKLPGYGLECIHDRRGETGMLQQLAEGEA
jgi:hypothetical protein